METWRTIPGYSLYQVSDQGRVRRKSTGRILKPVPWRGTNYGRVSLYNGTGRGRPEYVHLLVMAAFVGPRPEGMVTRHLNGNALDNRPENLRYGTYKENQADSIRHGTQAQKNKTHCPQQHEYTQENTKLYRGRRYCRECHRLDSRKRRAARKSS